MAQPVPETDFDPANPLHTLSDNDLTEAITNHELRIQLADNDATMYGPAEPDTDDNDAVAPATEWAHNELAELRGELARRTHLTPEQAAAEDATRTSNRDIDTTTFEPPEHLFPDAHPMPRNEGPGL